MSTITSANSVFLLGITGLFPTAQLLQGYMADAAWDNAAVKPAETVLGVDGNMSYGWLPRMYEQTISLMPDSPAATLFEDWVVAMDGQEEIYPCFGSLTLPSVGRSYVLANGVLSSYVPIPKGGKILQGRPFIITWNTVTPIPV
jgi:hypothetical protein